MEFRVTARRAQPDTADAPLLVLALPSGATLTPALTALDAALGGALRRSLDRKDFRGARDETLVLPGGAKGAAARASRRLRQAQRASSRCTASRRERRARARRARLGAPSLALFAEEQSDAAIEADRRWPHDGLVGIHDHPQRAARRRAQAGARERADSRERRSEREGRRRPRLRDRRGDQPRTPARRCSRATFCTPEYLANTAREIAKPTRNERHGARTRRDEGREDGIVPRGRAGHAAGSQADRARAQEGSCREQARRSRRQGTLLRFRRHLDQARARDGAHEVRHVRRGRRARRDGRDRRARSADQRGRVSSAAPRTCRLAKP